MYIVFSIIKRCFWFWFYEFFKKYFDILNLLELPLNLASWSYIIDHICSQKMYIIMLKKCLSISIPNKELSNHEWCF